MTGEIPIAFFGTPQVAADSLQALHDDGRFDIRLVVTNPDRPAGRKQLLTAPPVKDLALRLGIDVAQPDKVRDVEPLLTNKDVTVAAVVAYGAFLPQKLLGVVEHGFINLHFSLLPRWRGAAPVQHALRQGDTTTGVTAFQIDAGMDTGPVLRQVDTDIGVDETSGDLLHRLTSLGAPVLADALAARVAGERGSAQSDAGVTLAPKITSADTFIDITQDATAVHNLVRSANPAPGAHTLWQGQRFKIWKTSTVEPNSALATEVATAALDTAAPGAVTLTQSGSIVLQTGKGAVQLHEVQPAGKARMRAGDWARGWASEGAAQQLGQTAQDTV